MSDSESSSTNDPVCPVCSEFLEDTGCGLSCLECGLIQSEEQCCNGHVSILALGSSQGDCKGYNNDPRLKQVPKNMTVKIDNQEVNIYEVFREHGPFMFEDDKDAENKLRLYQNHDTKPYLCIDRETLEFDFYEGTGLMWQCQDCCQIYYSSTD